MSTSKHNSQKETLSVEDLKSLKNYFTNSKTTGHDSYKNETMNGKDLQSTINSITDSKMRENLLILVKHCKNFSCFRNSLLRFGEKY